MAAKCSAIMGMRPQCSSSAWAEPAAATEQPALAAVVAAMLGLSPLRALSERSSWGSSSSEEEPGEGEPDFRSLRALVEEAQCSAPGSSAPLMGVLDVIEAW